MKKILLSALTFALISFEIFFGIIYSIIGAIVYLAKILYDLDFSKVFFSLICKLIPDFVKKAFEDITTFSDSTDVSIVEVPTEQTISNDFRENLERYIVSGTQAEQNDALKRMGSGWMRSNL